MRPESIEANQVLNRKYRVLDKGFVALVDYMGNNDTVAFDARRSYQKGTKKLSTNERLIQRLYEDRHTSPFEMVELKFFVSAPICVVREWFRHRTASINELSGRYSQIPEEFFFPDQFRVQSTTNKQGSAGVVANDVSAYLIDKYEESARTSYALYEEALSLGVAREHARINLPVNIYTNFVWKIDLHNFLHFCGLRRDEAALEEIREYAHVMFSLAETLAPAACEAFMDNHPSMYGGKFNRGEMDFLRDWALGSLVLAHSQEEEKSAVMASVIKKLTPRNIESRPLKSLVELVDDEETLQPASV